MNGFSQCFRIAYLAISHGDFLGHNAFVNFHGENCARLSFNRTVHGWKYTRSRWMVILDTLLFFGPAIQVQELHKTFVDNIAPASRWIEETTSRFQPFSKSTFSLSPHLRLMLNQATVLLNANVGFLGLTKGGRSFIEMASCMSLVASLGSIVLGLFFVSQHRISGQSTDEEVVSNSGCSITAIFLTAPDSGKFSFKTSR